MAVGEQGVEHRQLVAERLLPEAVPVATTTWRPARAKSMAAAWCDHSASRPWARGQPRADHLGQVAGASSQPRRPGRQALQGIELAAVVGVTG